MQHCMSAGTKDTCLYHLISSRISIRRCKGERKPFYQISFHQECRLASKITDNQREFCLQLACVIEQHTAPTVADLFVYTELM